MKERDRALLRLVAARRSYREMAQELQVALGTIQNMVRRLKRAGCLIGPPTRKARMLTLTRKGKHVLHRKNFIR